MKAVADYLTAEQACNIIRKVKIANKANLTKWKASARRADDHYKVIITNIDKKNVWEIIKEV